MKCYNDAYNLCLSCDTNPFEYRQMSINNEELIIATEKTTQNSYEVTEYGSQVINPCDSDSEYEAIDLYRCYRLYLQNCATSQVDAVSFSSQISETVSSVNDTFNNFSNNGISVTGNNNTNLVVPSNEENLVHLGNIAILASLMYEQNSTGAIPPILDANNNIYQLNYESLSDLMLQYFSQTTNSYYIQSNLQKTLSTTDNATTINKCEYCSAKTPQSFETPTTIVSDVVDVLLENDPDRVQYEVCGGIIYYVYFALGVDSGSNNCNGTWYTPSFKTNVDPNDNGLTSCPEGCEKITDVNYSCGGPLWPFPWNQWLPYASCQKP
jgi:hypothetical protein